MSTETREISVRDFQPGDVVRTGVGVQTVESVKVGRVWATVRLEGVRTAMTLQVDEVWTVTRP